MAKRTDRPTHPAKKFYLFALICMIITILFSFITVFVPWAQRDIAVGMRIYAYPFHNCLEYTFNPLHQEVCQSNDYTAATSVSGGNKACRGEIIAVIVFVFSTVIIGVVFGLPLFALVLMKLWSRPIYLALYLQLALTAVLAPAWLAWGFWLSYAETVCANNILFPLKGYSYGFILHVFCAWLMLMAWIAGYLGLIKIVSWKPFKGAEYGDAPYGMDAPMSPSGTAPAPSPFAPSGGYFPPASGGGAYPPASGGMPLPYNLYQ